MGCCQRWGGGGRNPLKVPCTYIHPEVGMMDTWVRSARPMIRHVHQSTPHVKHRGRCDSPRTAVQCGKDRAA